MVVAILHSQVHRCRHLAKAMLHLRQGFLDEKRPDFAGLNAGIEPIKVITHGSGRSACVPRERSKVLEDVRTADIRSVKNPPPHHQARVVRPLRSFADTRGRQASHASTYRRAQQVPVLGKKAPSAS